MDVNEIKNKITNYEYLESLILKNIKSTAEYSYPKEWSNLMLNINYIYHQQRPVPFTYDDFRLFTDGTVSKLFKKSLSQKDIVQAYETDKLSNLAHLPTEIAVTVFSQEEMIDALEMCDDLAIDHICTTGGPEISVIMGSGLLRKARTVEEQYFSEKYDLRRLEQKRDELRELQNFKTMERTEYIKLRDEILDSINEKRGKVVALENIISRCNLRAKDAMDYSASVFKKKYTSEYSEVNQIGRGR